MDEHRNVLCMKWGKKYAPDYVNKLYRMVCRNLEKPFRFVCLTDDDTGIDANIECFPLPELNMPDGGPERGWNKLTSFINPLYDLQGKILFLDLDVVIVGSLDEFFDQVGDFHIIEDFVRRDGTGNSSVYMFHAGEHADILQNFCKNHSTIRAQFRNEQEYLSHYLTAKNKKQYWPKEWCRSFKHDCFPGGVLGSWLCKSRVPKNARVIIFHGLPNPHQALVGISGKWYRKVSPATWINQYWYE